MRTKQQISIILPEEAYSPLGHVRNIEYCLKQLQKAEQAVGEPVVGFLVERSLGTQYAYYKLFPRSVAESRKERDPRFRFVTRRDLLMRLDEIDMGRFTLRRGAIVGVNESVKATPE